MQFVNYWRYTPPDVERVAFSYTEAPKRSLPPFPTNDKSSDTKLVLKLTHLCDICLEELQLSM